MNRDDLAIEVWCRRPSALVQQYQALGIPCRIVPEIPLFRAQARLGYTIRTLVVAMGELRRRRPVLETLAHEIATRFDVVHFNFESLWLFARWLRRRVAVPFVMHMRNRPMPSPWARWQSRYLPRLFARFVFITDNERREFIELGGSATKGEVVFNPGPPVDAKERALPDASAPLVAALIGNAGYTRGIDRAVDIAAVLAARGSRDGVRFIVAGDCHTSPSDPGMLGEIGRAGGTIADYAERLGVRDCIDFLGHVSNVDGVLARSDIVVRLDRRNAPWGRDVIEALAAGLPVMATGTWGGFVRDGVDGWLIGEFDAARCADLLMAAAADRAQLRAMGESARRHVLDVCDPVARGNDLARIWRAVAAEQT